MTLPPHARLFHLFLSAALASPGPCAAMGRRPPEPENAPAPVDPKLRSKETHMNLADPAARDITPSEWKGQFGGPASSAAALIETAEQWERLWREDMGREAPPVDFGRYFAAAVFLGSRNTGGYDVVFLEPQISPDSVRVFYRVRGPGKGQFVIQAFTQPYAIKLYRKTGLKAALVEQP